MKKSAISTAIAAAAMISTGAHASASISSNITGIQLHIGYMDVEFPCPAPYATGLALTGANPDVINMTGQICINVGPSRALTVNLTGTHLANGVIFNGGSIVIDEYIGGVWAYSSTVTPTSLTPINCLVNQTGHLGGSPAPINITFGLQVPPAGKGNSLPGLWSGAAPPSIGMNDAVCVIELFGQRGGLFFEGNIWN